jgi:hypothetical protein
MTAKSALFLSFFISLTPVLIFLENIFSFFVFIKKSDYICPVLTKGIIKHFVMK